MRTAAGILQRVTNCGDCLLLIHQVNLPDDRVIIVSGFLDDPARQSGKPAPSIDVFDYKSRR
jgi:hypothetical protein